MRAFPATVTAPVVALCLGLFGLGCDDEIVDDLPLEPQIFPRINPVNICEYPVGRQKTVDLMLDNRGQNRLDIYSYEVHHDRRCAFAEPNGMIELYDNTGEGDEFAAQVRSRDSAFMRIAYSPPAAGEDQVSVIIHSNAANQPDLEIFICGAGTTSDVLTCNIRRNPECRDTGESCDDANPCDLRCLLSGEVCSSSADCPDDGDFCHSPHYCVLEDPTDPNSGTCQCRPCSALPDESWEDCPDA